MLEEQTYLKNLYSNKKLNIAGTNVWLTSDIINDSLKVDKDRGSEEQTYYNMFVRITGVENKTEYCRELFFWKNKLLEMGKTVYILEDIKPVTVEEVNKINPGNYLTVQHLVTDLSRKIKCPFKQLENQVLKAFVDTIIEESLSEKGSFGRLRNRAISLLCWFYRYGRYLFKNEVETNLPVLIYFGTCKNSMEALLLRFFANLPLDVIIINPNLKNECKLKDSKLFDRRFEESLEVSKFPEKIDELSFATVAYNAERDLETMMYQDTGMYKIRQHSNAVAIILKTMYEEIYILWDQENRMRPSFEILGERVVVPTICAKVCGVKDGDTLQYWKDVKKLVDEDTILITEANFYDKNIENFNSTNMIKNNKIDRESILKTKHYKYGIYREEMQKYMLDKLDELIESKIIKGTFSNGVEYRIIDVIMNLDKAIIRLIQNIDFTKINPKIVLINTTEVAYPLEESIVLAYLRLIGFDIVLFIPTGYRVIENFYKESLFVEHDIGEFIYDLNTPNNIKEKVSKDKKENLLHRLLRR